MWVAIRQHVAVAAALCVFIRTRGFPFSSMLKACRWRVRVLSSRAAAHTAATRPFSLKLRTHTHPPPICLPACLQVHYEHPLLGAGWLSASGTLEAADDATLVINFKRFWWDLGPLRAELPSSSSGSQGSSSGSQGSGGNALLDSIVGALGRASFLPQFARFPVQQLDGQAGLAVFRFPPLASSIAVARCSSSPSTSSASGSSADGSLPVA